VADEKTYTLPEFAQKLSVAMRGLLAKHEADIANLLSREQKLAKNYQTPGSATPSNTGMGSMGGGGTQPMGMSEPLGKCALCKSTEHRGMCKAMNSEGDGGAAGLAMGEKEDTLFGKEPKKKDVLPKGPSPSGSRPGTGGACSECGKVGHTPSQHLKKDQAGLSDVGSLSKSGTTPHLDEVKPGLAKAMPSSSAAALAPKAPAPTTPVSHVNQELGGFKSLASSPTAMPSAYGMTGGGRKPIASMGRAKAAVSGSIPNAKSEKNPGSAKPYGTGGPGHATQANMPSALKANMATAKSEKDASAKTTVGRGLDDKAVPGSKMPKAGKSVDTKKPGSGGELRKDAEIPGKVKGVGGKQPVGQGGGDVLKPVSTPAKAGVGTAPGLPKVGGQRPLASAKDSPALQHFGRGAVDVNLDGARHRPLAAATDSPGAQHFGRGAVDVDVSDLNGAPVPARGGVGFLNGLVGKTRPQAIAPAPIQAPIQSQRFHGALPLRRGEGDMGAPIEKCALCKGAEHRGLCKGLSSINHNRNMLRVKP
jgi:hypothetical protein